MRDESDGLQRTWGTQETKREERVRERNHGSRRREVGTFSFNLYSARLGSLLTLGLGSRSVSSGSLSGLLGILHVRGPEGKVVTEELHDEGRVLVALLREGVKLSDGIVEGLLGEVASAVGRVQDLVVEDREVKGKTKADGVGRGELGDGNVRSSLVSLERLVGGVLALVTGGELGEVSVVVTLPVKCANREKKSVEPKRRCESKEKKKVSLSRSRPSFAGDLRSTPRRNPEISGSSC